jgi:hypothetical protein
MTGSLLLFLSSQVEISWLEGDFLGNSELTENSGEEAHNPVFRIHTIIDGFNGGRIYSVRLKGVPEYKELLYSIRTAVSSATRRSFKNMFSCKVQVKKQILWWPAVP